MFKTKRQFEDELAVFMAGHVAESMVFDEQSTGAANDIERATMLAATETLDPDMGECIHRLVELSVDRRAG